MNILWVPHTSDQRGIKPRASYFIERLAAEHTIHVVEWDASIAPTPQGLARALRVRCETRDRIRYHHVPRLPYRLDLKRRGAPVITQALVRRAIRRIVGSHDIEVVVSACNWYALGFPPPDLPVPLVLDYFDILTETHERLYFSRASAVVCASRVMHERARKFTVPSYYLPNGIDVRLFRTASGEAVRREHALEGSRVVSLIGLTASPRLYFLEAIDVVARNQPDVKCLLVGDGELRHAIARSVKGREHRFRLVGPIEYARMPEFFAATDVGLYPADQTPPFDAALPIKVLEYSAAGKPVVAPRLDELSRLGFPNLLFAEPTAEGFARAIDLALQHPARSPDLSRFEIGTLSTQLAEILAGLVTSQHTVPGGMTCTAAKG